MGIALVIFVPIAIIVSVIRSAIRDLRGRSRDYTAGTIGLSDIPQRPKRIRHFADGAPDDE